jgi:hypothetical protein
MKIFIGCKLFHNLVWLRNFRITIVVKGARMKKQALYTIPMYVMEFDNHEKNKLLYKTFIDEYLDNKPLDIKYTNISKGTKRNLHSVSVFDDLIYFISNLCPEIHKDYKISSDKTIGLTDMWASKCSVNEFIPDQYQQDRFLYGVYFLNTPKSTGKMHISLDITDRNYYDNIGPDENNLINTNKFTCLTPEGTILLMPAHLTTSFSENFQNESRYMLHFCLKVID